ncbi:Hypothetical protein, putative [Bodo saltans]|uniref:Uncharacterized protein n=1 Tax=Bodo saltans TaxID=75058 RepID=A0A0S4KGR7_BODSA|nr:Hypothetical protein, putative [Bodo saltans]|eukprot:CUI10775.1 Hypothetical protein, putative [Bodo saltans]
MRIGGTFTLTSGARWVMTNLSYSGPTLMTWAASGGTFTQLSPNCVRTALGTVLDTARAQPEQPRGVDRVQPERRGDDGERPCDGACDRADGGHGAVPLLVDELLDVGDNGSAH